MTSQTHYEVLEFLGRGTFGQVFGKCIILHYELAYESQAILVTLSG